MMTRDGYSNFKFFQCIYPATHTAAVTGQSVDRQGFETLTFVVNVNFASLMSTTSAWFIRMQHGDSDTDGSIGWSNVQESQMLYDALMKNLISGPNGFSATNSTGSGPAEGIFIHFGISTGSASDFYSDVFQGGYLGNRRWVRAVLSQSTVGDQSAIALDVLAVLGNEATWPVNTINRVS